MHALLIPALLAALVATTTGTALAAPDHACRQTGQVPAAPPLIPQGFRIDECSSFAGGADAASFGRNWCAHAAKVTLGLGDVPPKVTTLDACPKGAVALCTAQVPNSTVTVTRHFYVADPGAGGIEGLRTACEGRRRKATGAVFTVL